MHLFVAFSKLYRFTEERQMQYIKRSKDCLKEYECPHLLVTTGPGAPVVHFLWPELQNLGPPQWSLQEMEKHNPEHS